MHQMREPAPVAGSCAFGTLLSSASFIFDHTLNPAGEIATTTRSNDSYAYTGHANANVTGTANGLNQLTAIGGVSDSHDSRGNVSAIGSSSYGCSSENLLTSAPSSTTLSYDPANRLYQTAGGSTTRFGYDGGNMIGEYNSSNALQRCYVFGPGSDEPLVQYEGSGTSTRRWFHADERGSVAAVSDANGDVVTAVNRYDEYGNVQGTLTGRFGYTGQAWVPEIGMAYYRARIYNPALGRFMQSDPIGFGGGMNPYAYTGNNPVNFTDPLGLCDEPGGDPCPVVDGPRRRQPDPHHETTYGNINIYPGALPPPPESEQEVVVIGTRDPAPEDESSDVTVVGTPLPRVILAGQTRWGR